MNNADAINTRISSRGFLEEPIDLNKVIILKRIMHELNKESGLNFIYLENAGSAFEDAQKEGKFLGVRDCFVLKGKTNEEHLKEKIGYFGERLVLDITKLGLGSCWVVGSANKQSNIFQVMPDETLVALIPFGNIKENEALTQKLLRGEFHRPVKNLNDFYEADVTPQNWFIEAIKYVRKAPTARNLQLVKIFLKNNVITASVPLTNEVELIDLGIAKLHFELSTRGRFDLGNHGQFHISKY